jgi:hypothetical protein
MDPTALTNTGLDWIASVSAIMGVVLYILMIILIIMAIIALSKYIGRDNKR